MVTRRDFLSLFAVGVGAGLAAPASSAERDASAPTASAPGRADPWLEINTANLIWNLRQIQARVGDKPVMAVVKANAYGHGLVGVARVLEGAGVKHFLVGKLDEARQLRAAGLRGLILNFGPFAEADAEDIVRLEISQNVYTEEVKFLARAARRLEKPAHVHIKVDTGLGRVGVPYDRAAEVIERVAALSGVTVDGLFTTFTEDPEFDPLQLTRLQEISARARQAGVSVGLRHAASSDAILTFPASYTELDLVRPGIMLYGLYPSEKAEAERTLDLKPALALKARVVYVKTLRPGESVSYHRAFVATEPERVASLPVGYSDGYPRGLAGKGSVLIGGRHCPIVAITSNATMVRLGDVPAEVGNEAVLMGAQGSEEISASEVGRLTATNVYAVVIGMSPALPPVYL